ASRAETSLLYDSHTCEILGGHHLCGSSERCVAMHVNARGEKSRPPELMPRDGAEATPARCLRPGARRPLALVDVHDERVQPGPPRLVEQRVLKVQRDAGKPRRRKREQVVDLPRAGLQWRIQ